MRLNAEDTIVAISTPLGESGIGIVRLSGPDALKIADMIFLPKSSWLPSECGSYTVHYGHIVRKQTNDEPRTSAQRCEASPKGANDEIIDEVLLTVMRAPKSYTKEDIVEINCHGGPAVLKETLELMVRLGARVAEPGEFTKRAFLNGRIDLAQAEAVLDVIKARTDASLKAAMGQLDGTLSKKISEISEALTGVLARIEAALDFSEEDIRIIGSAEAVRIIEGVKKEAVKLADTFDEGVILREGVLAIICGKPNVGKSSLMNLLLKRDRVMVNPIPGTTRDAVEETINIKGFPVTLVDTAGIFEAKDCLDNEAVRRAKDYLDRADLVLFVLDGSRPIEAEDLAIAGLIRDRKAIGVINKIDLPRKITALDAKNLLGVENAVSLSITEKRNIESLEDGLFELLASGKVFAGEGSIVTNARHKASLASAIECIERALQSLREGLSMELAAQDLRESVYQLGLIVGKSVSDDILDRIFSEFCIGK